MVSMVIEEKVENVLEGVPGVAEFLVSTRMRRVEWRCLNIPSPSTHHPNQGSILQPNIQDLLLVCKWFAQGDIIASKILSPVFRIYI